MNKEVKEFKLLPDGKLQIDVHGDDKLFIPSKDGNVIVGSFKQHTIQLVDKDKIVILQDFIKQNKELTEGQLVTTNKTLEKLKGMTEILPDDLRNKITKHLAKNAKKASLLDLKELNQHLKVVNQKKQSEQHQKYLVDQLEKVNDDYNKLKKAIEG